MIHTKRHRSSRALFDPENLQNLKKKTQNNQQTKPITNPKQKKLTITLF